MDSDVIIIGAGVAGLSAAKALQERGLSCLIFEASHRIGGRAYAESLGQTWFDLGCSYLHEGEINPFVDIARHYGFALGDGDRFSDDKTMLRHGGRLRDHNTDLQMKAINAAFAQSLAKTERTNDQSLADAMNWDDALTPVQAFIMAGLNASDSDKQSAWDFNQSGFGPDYPVHGSLGRLIATWGSTVEVHLNTAVSDVNTSGNLVAVTTSSGTAYARHVIVTVSTGILANHQITFFPELPEQHQEAIQQLPCGVLNKIGIEFTANSFDADMAGWSVGWDDAQIDAQIDTKIDAQIDAQIDALIDDSHIATIDLNLDNQAPQAVAFAGGSFGEYLEKQGKAAMEDYAKSSIAMIYGSDAAKNITSMITTAWASEPMTLGSYSYALPQAVDARKHLGQSIDQRLFFAGEAVSTNHYGTCHGAYLSGIDTAHAIAAIHQMNPK